MRLVMIEWTDASGCNSAWESFEDNPGGMCCHIKSVGWLYYDGVSCKKIIPHYGQENKYCAEQFCGAMTIPVASIVTIIDIGPP